MKLASAWCTTLRALLLIAILAPCGHCNNSAKSRSAESGVTAKHLEKCPNLCTRQGVCVAGLCRCYQGFTAPDCSQVTQPSPLLLSIPPPVAALHTPPDRLLQICLVSEQAPHSHLSTDLSAVIPQAPLARSLASRGHSVTLLFFLEKDFPPAKQWQAELAQSGVELVPLYYTRHYYLSPTIAHSFEAYAWLHDRALAGLTPFNAVQFDLGLGYFAGLAKAQRNVNARLNNTLLITVVEAPHSWLLNEGGGLGGPSSVDDLEIDFVHRESARLADDVIFPPGGALAKWCADKGWKFGGPLVGLNRVVMTKLTEQRTVGGGGLGVVFLIEGLGCPAEGGTYSSEGTMGGNASDFADSAQAYCLADAMLAADSAELLQSVSPVTFLLLGEGHPGGEVLGAWGGPGKDKWEIKTVSTRQEMLEGARICQVAVFCAARHRGGDTLATVRQLAAVAPRLVVAVHQKGEPWVLEAATTAGRGVTVVRATAQAVAEAVAQALSREVVVRKDTGTDVAQWVGWYEKVVAESSSGFSTPDRTSEATTAAKVTMGMGGEVATPPGGGVMVGAAAGAASRVAELAGKARNGEVSKTGGVNRGQSAPPLVCVVMTTYNRPQLLREAVQSIAAQDYPAESLQLLLVDDGSTDPTALEALWLLEMEMGFAWRGWKVLREPNRYLGGARNAGARYCKGKYLMFVDDDNYAKPTEVATFVRAMENSGADILTSFVDFVTTENDPHQAGTGASPMCSHTVDGQLSPASAAGGMRSSPGFVFLGGSAAVGLFKNCFGDANSFFRRSSFEELGGYTEDRGVGYEDWELYAKAVLEGYTLQVVPQALYHYRFTQGSMQKSTSYSQSRKRALRAYLTKLRPNATDANLARLRTPHIQAKKTFAK